MVPDGRLGALKLVVLCLSQLMDALDGSCVYIAIASIARERGMDEAQAAWVLAAFNIAFGSLLLVCGRIGDLFGHRNVFLFGLVWFSLWCIVSGLALSAELLIVSRALQGVGAAATIPTGMALITANYHGPERDRAFGISGMCASFGYMFGLIIGGVLAEWVGYQWIFYMCAIITGVQAIVAVFVIPDDREANRKLQEDARRKYAESRQTSQKQLLGGAEAAQPVHAAVVLEELTWWGRFDVLGGVLITAAIVFFVFIITEGSYIGWTSPINIAFIVLTPILFVAFIFVEHRKEDQALMPLDVWRIPNFAALFLTLVCSIAAANASMFWYTQFWQYVLEISPMYTGVQFSPLGLSIIFVMPLAVWILPKVGLKSILILSAVLNLAAMIISCFFTADMSYWGKPFAALLLLSISYGLIIYCVMVEGMSSAPPEWQGLASALLNVSTQIGTAVVLAISTAVSSSTANTNILTATKDDLVAGYRNAFWLIVALFALELVIAVFFVHDLPRATQPQPQPPEQHDVQLDAMKIINDLQDLQGSEP